MTDHDGRPVAAAMRRLAACWAAVALTAAACTSATPGPSSNPSGGAAGITAGLGGAWRPAPVELPASVTGQAGGTTNIHCSPCHSVQVDLLFGVAPMPDGFVAVGVQEPPAMAVAWRSSDGSDWTSVSGLPAGPGSVATAAATQGGRIVVVGGDAAGATSWASDDGATWTAAPDAPDLAAPTGGAAQMTAVTAWDGGFVAVGYQDDPAHGHAMAAIWTSPDGLAWRRVPSGPAFQEERLFGVTARAGTLVAVGTTADLFGGPAAVWVSYDGVTWTRASNPALAAGPMRAVTATAGGFVAVGFGASDDRAAAWISPDGLAWQAASDGPVFANHTLPIRMAAVAAGPDGLIAVGWKSDAGNGSGTVWRSADGLVWRRDPAQASLTGGELNGVAIGPHGPIGAGIAGYPDNDQASVWLGPP